MNNYNEPNHYDLNGKNTMDLIIELVKNDKLDDEALIFYKCNIYKYLIRAEKKNKIEDYKKALDYLNRFIDTLESVDNHEKA